MKVYQFTVKASQSSAGMALIAAPTPEIAVKTFARFLAGDYYGYCSAEEAER